MQRDTRVVHKALEELVHKLGIQPADHARREVAVQFEPWTTGKVDHNARQRLVERHIGVTVAGEAFLVADRFGESLADRDTDVFHRVVAIDMQVAFTLNVQVDQAVAGDLIEHVIKEPDSGGELGLTSAVQVEPHGDTGLERVTGDFDLPHGALSGGNAHRGLGSKGHDSIASLRRSSVAGSPRPPNFPLAKIIMSRFWSDVVRGLTPYVPGEQPKLANLVKLNTNENPYGPSPRALEAIAAEAGDSLRLYPDPNADRLKAAIAAHHGITPAQVFVGNGSDEVLAHAFMALLKHDAPLLFPDISYSFYPVYCGLYGIEPGIVPLDDHFGIRIDDYIGRTNGGIIFPNPNAPTGCLLPLSEIERLLEHNTNSVVVVDEAYVDFGGESAISLIDRFPNLLVVQTLSKSRSLAGLRVGFATGHPDLIEALERVKNSFNSYPLDRLAIAGAVAAFEDDAYFRACCDKVVASRTRLVGALAGLGFEVLPSAANFIFARHPQRDAAQLAAQLRERSIIVRHFRQPRIEQFLRITIGTDAQCDTLLQALNEILAG